MDMVRETTLHHLALACEDLEGKGLGGKVNPPIRDRSDNEALWAGLRHGLVTTVASDHACCMEESKGDDLWPALPGFGGTALLYPVLISEGLHKRGIPLSRIVEVASAAPAQAYNLYPRKGTIAVGSDADLAVVDLDLEQVVTTELCHSAQDHTPFEGIAVKGWPPTHSARRARLPRRRGGRRDARRVPAPLGAVGGRPSHRWRGHRAGRVPAAATSAGAASAGPGRCGGVRSSGSGRSTRSGGVRTSAGDRRR